MVWLLMTACLFFQVQVEEAAHKKHGGPEGLEEHRRTQLSAKVEKRAAKRKEDSQKVGVSSVHYEMHATFNVLSCMSDLVSLC